METAIYVTIYRSHRYHVHVISACYSVQSLEHSFNIRYVVLALLDELKFSSHLVFVAVAEPVFRHSFLSVNSPDSESNTIIC